VKSVVILKRNWFAINKKVKLFEKGVFRPL